MLDMYLYLHNLTFCIDFFFVILFILALLILLTYLYFFISIYRIIKKMSALLLCNGHFFGKLQSYI